MKRFCFVLTTMLAAACFADGAGMAPINPAFLKWKARKERREAEKAAQTNQVKKAELLTAAGTLASDEVDYGYMPPLFDKSYLANINTGAKRAISQQTLPAVYDLRSLSRLTPVKNQNPYGTCWAHATMASLESWLLTSENKTFDFSENNLANLHGGDWGFNDGGNGDRASAYLLRWAGPVLESQDPYPNWGGSSPFSPSRHVQRVRWIPPKASGAHLYNDEIKSAIVKYGAVYASYFHSASYYNSSYKSYYCPKESYGNHAVTVVGWDDNFAASKFTQKPAGNGAFIVRNSWGTSWGENGYFYVSYYDCIFGHEELFAFCNAEETSNYSKVYQYDPLGLVLPWSPYNTTVVYMSAIYLATASENIGAVGFYATAPNMPYTITVRTAVTSGKPSSGTLQLTQSGVVDDAGYVTVPLTDAVPVSSGSRFSIIVKITRPDGCLFPIAVEYAIPDYTSSATASSGQTFVSADGSSWTDCYSWDSTRNVCLKAYVSAGSVAKKLVDIGIYTSDNSSNVASGKTKQLTCKATYSDGLETAVKPTWSVTSGDAYGSVDSTGLFTAKDVTSSQSVVVKARYTEGGVMKEKSATLTITVAAPQPPTGLTATAGTESSCVRLAWTAASGATGYTVYRATGSGASSSNAKSIGRVDQPKYADNDATPGVDYTYFVKAKNGSGTSGFSAGASGWRALAAPSDVAASDGASTEWVKVSWGEVEGASAYRVYRGTSEANMTALGSWQTELSYTDRDAEPGTLYTYAVKAALDTSGTRASELSVSDTGIREKKNAPVSLAIEGPATLTSGARSSYSAKVLWSNGTTTACTPTWTCGGNTSTAATYAYTAPVVSANQTVTLTAKLTVEGVTLSGSHTITVTPAIPAAPSAPTVTAKTTDGVSLSWSAVSGAASYVIYRGTSTTASSATEVGKATGTTFTDRNVEPGKTVYYFIAAVNTAGTGARSPASAAAVRTLAAPTGVMASNGTYADKVRVTWSAVSGATHYRVSRATSQSGSQTDLGSWQTGTTYDDTSATAGTTYYYFVRAATSSSGANVSAKSSPGAKGLRKVEVLPDTLEIIGPDRVNAGATAQYAAKAAYTDKSTQTVTAGWSRSGTAATIDSTGKLAAASVTADATVTLTASYTEGGKTVTATKQVTVVAPIAKTVTVSNVKATSRWPWKPIIDIDYTLAVSPADTKADISVEATDKDRRQTFLAQTLTGDTEDLAAGAHRVSWNVGADKPDFATSALDIDVKARVRAVPQPKSTYIVVDLSGGTEAASYPIEELDAVPSGGWTDAYKTTKLVLRRIEPGTFTMGSPSDELGRSSSEDLHRVTLTKPFYIGVFEVTQRQWELVMGTKPSWFNNAGCYQSRPVEQVSYDDIRGSSAGAGWPASSAVDATSFLGKLRAKTGLSDFDLPTEAQWEYACRAGTTTALNSGKNLTSTSSDANMAEVGRYWYNGGSSYSSSGDTSVGIAKVGSYAPNAWGLYDMHGNVWEYCLDWYTSSLGTSAVTDPVGSGSGSYRVQCGGCWCNSAITCRSASRYSSSPSYASGSFGFRLCSPAGQGDAIVSVAFDANGGSTAVSSQTYAKGGKYTALPAATRAGYMFAGWYTAASGGTQVTASTAVPSANTTLWAHWTAIVPTALAIGGNASVQAGKSATYTATATYNDGTTKAVTAKSWSLSSGSSYGSISAAGVFTANGTATQRSVTIAATYEENGVTVTAPGKAVTITTYAVTVTFNGNGGTPASTTQTYTAYGTYGSFPSVSRAGYNLAGWYTAASGGTQVSTSTAAPSANTTLWAHWTAIVPSAPTGVSATDGTHADKVVVSWAAVGGATSYEVWRYTSNASGSAAKIGTATATSYEDKTATPGTTYYYWVKACRSDNGQTSAFSAGDSGYRKKIPTALAIGGNASVQAGKSATYTATATYNDGTTKAVTAKSWSLSSGSSYGSISAAGVFTANGTATQRSVTIAATYEENGVTVAAPGKGVTITTYAVTVTFNGNGGTPASTTQDYTAYGTYGSFPSVSRAGYNLAGWYTAASGGTQVSASTVVPSANTTLWAHWVNPSKTYLVIDLSGGTGATSYPVSYLSSVPSGGWTDVYKTTKLVLRRIEPGTFTMGSPRDEVGRDSDEEDQHQVTLTMPFYMGVFEVTQRQWELVMGSKPSYFSNASYYASRPVEQVSYNDIRGSSAGAGWPASSAVDATSFLGKLRAKTGLQDFDLPTEAQWEYACRAGTTTALNSGKNLTSAGPDANMAEVGRYRHNSAYYTDNGCTSSSDTTQGTAKVGSYAPNAWGLYDMHGNVREWCLDRYTPSLGTSAVTDPVGPTSGSHRIQRGGSWNYSSYGCRSAFRNNSYPLSTLDHNGFRLCVPAGL